jgi:hypothetical protein
VLGNVITQWNFNSQPLDAPENTATGSFVPLTGLGTLEGAGSITTATFSTGLGSTDNTATDNSGAQTTGYPAQGNGSGTTGVAFKVSTVGKDNIVVYWDLRHSNTSSRYTQFQYTTDGTTWNNYEATGDLTEAGLYVGNTGDTWFLQRKADLSAISAVNNNSNFAFRIVTAFAPGTSAYAAAQTAYGPTGTLRYDMVTVTGVVGVFNTAPTDITLSSASFPENNSPNLVVGTLTTTDDNAAGATYSFATGTGDTDNEAFNISGNSLRATNALDFETKSIYSVLIRTTDAGGLTYTKQFTITVTDVVEGTTYNDWLQAQGVTPSDANAAMLDYAFGATTLGALDSTLKPSVAIVPPAGGVGGDTATLVLTYYVRQNAVGLRVTPNLSLDLSAVGGGFAPLDPTQIEGHEINDLGGGVSVQRMTASVPMIGDRKFLKLEVLQQ